MTIWDQQRAFMQACNQPLPDHPQITAGSVLYAGLVLEEAAEMLTTLRKALLGCQVGLLSTWDIEEIEKLGQRLKRGVAQGVVPPVVSEDIELVADLADDTTDILYVTVGTQNSSGLPGQECWDEVQSSNMTKPVNGKVIKDASGKVMKPANYRPANLRAVVEAAYVRG